MERIKNHIREHKTEYLIVGIAGITYVIVRGRYAGIPRVPDGHIVTVRPLSFFSNRSNIVNVFLRDGRGHPGYLVADMTTGAVYPSQKEAAHALNVWPSVVSGHLKGKITDVHGHILERLEA